MPKKSIILDALSYDPKEGGFATVYRDLAQTLTEISDIDTIIICHKKHKKLFREYKARLISVWFPYKLRYFASLIITPILVLYLRPIQTHFETTAVPLFINSKVSITIHDLFFLKENYRGALSVGSKLLDLYWKHFFTWRVKRADKVRVVSKGTCRDVEELLGIQKKVEVVYPVIESPETNNLPAPYPKQNQPLKILFVGSIIPRKNLAFLLRALELVKRPYTLDIVGNNWDKSTIAQAKNNKKIKFHGFVEQAQLEVFYRQSHFLVSPSIEEGFGMPVVEAMVRSTPVLVSDIKVYAEFVDPSSRFRIDEPIYLAKMINGINSEFYFRQIQRNLEFSKLFSKDRFSKNIRKFFLT